MIKLLVCQNLAAGVPYICGNRSKCLKYRISQVKEKRVPITIPAFNFIYFLKDLLFQPAGLPDLMVLGERQGRFLPVF